MLLFSLFGTQISSESLLFGLFGLIIVVFLLLDLGVFHKTAHKITTKSALIQSVFWVIISTLSDIWFIGPGLTKLSKKALSRSLQARMPPLSISPHTLLSMRFL